MKRLQVLAVLFAGVAFGSGVTGCFAVWLGSAHAGGGAPPQGQIITVPCDVAGTVGGKAATFAVQSFPGSSREDLSAGVSIVVDTTPPSGFAIGGDSTYVPPVLGPVQYVKDGAVAIECSSGPGSPVQFYVRQ